MSTTTSSDATHLFVDPPHVAAGTLTFPPLADPDEPHRIVRSHLLKIDLGKSSSSCKAALITRLHRTTAMQEFWCASFEESQVYLNLAAHPDVVNFREQSTRVEFLKADGSASHTVVDAHALLRNGSEVLFSVKYEGKAKRASYLEEVESIARQCSRNIADRFVVVSRYSFHSVFRECALKIHIARRGWDPEADQIVLGAAHDLGASFSLQELLDRSGLGGRGYRAAVRLIGDGDIGKHPLDPIAYDTRLRGVKA
ncbi:hypothetical protein LX81_03533 [Palleronia aestuarii]|uniref:TnsA endonuclease-like protein n=1 Tax=Palleronia aestuarii TaxID=568105 RepID=A0A2W7NI48_9RHOB|nr:hypothetical protein [Palleronia aestuarii]PZX12826.1 hypothetical protein LX81_03533 [Palleronia aestuarii]